ncbi:MAG: hypothetical protein AAFS10_09495, partial [Myxococcota bacterium]
IGGYYTDVQWFVLGLGRGVWCLSTMAETVRASGDEGRGDSDKRVADKRAKPVTATPRYTCTKLPQPEPFIAICNR